LTTRPFSSSPYLDPDGSNPEHHLAGFTVRIDGGRLKPVPTPVGAAGSRVVPIFGVAQLTTNLFNLTLPGVPANAFPGSDFPITEIFVQIGKKHLVQLTNFRRVDTYSAFLNKTRTRLLPGIRRPAPDEPLWKLPDILH
jgi:hypothetical protein